MRERMTSPAEARLLGSEISNFVNRLEEVGFERGQIGAAMAGVALALVQVHVTHRVAMRLVKTLQAVLMADQTTKQ